MNLEDCLWTNYTNINTRIENAILKDEEYLRLIDDRDKVVNQLLKLYQINSENELKKYQIDKDADVRIKQNVSESRDKKDQLMFDNRKEKFNMVLSVSTFVVTTVVGIWGFKKTFIFDETGTITSTLGRSAINNVVGKIFKK